MAVELTLQHAERILFLLKERAPEYRKTATKTLEVAIAKARERSTQKRKNHWRETFGVEDK